MPEVGNVHLAQAHSNRGRRGRKEFSRCRALGATASEALPEEAHIKFSTLVSDLLGASARWMLKEVARHSGTIA